MKEEIISYLKEDARFRERANKDKGIANLIMKKYHIEIPKDKRDDVIKDILSADRYWRMALLENEELRGNDYQTKQIVEQRKELQLGYQPQGDIKWINNLK